MKRINSTLEPVSIELLLTLALVSLGLIVRLQQADAADQPRTEAVSSDDTRPPLPPRALLKIGTDDLRMRHHIDTVKFSPDGKIIACVAASMPVPTVHLFDVDSGRLIKQIVLNDEHGAWVSCISFSPDQKTLLWGESKGHVTLWDLINDRVQFREQFHTGVVKDLKLSPDGKVIATAGDDGTVLLRRVDDRTKPVHDGAAEGERPKADQRGKMVRSSGACCLEFTPDGTQLLVGDSRNTSISIWRVKDAEFVRQIENTHTNQKMMNPGLRSVLVTPDGKRIITAGQKTVAREQTTLKHVPKNVTLTVVRLWDFQAGDDIRDLNGDEDYGFGYAALSPDGKLIAQADFSLLKIRDAETGKLAQTISVPGSPGRQPVFSPDGTLVAMPIDNAIALFDVKTGRRLHNSAAMPAGEVISAAWSPAGDRIVTGQGDGGVRTWDASTGQLLWNQPFAPVISLSGHCAGPNFVAFSPDGKSVIVAGRRDEPVGGSNGIVAVFDAADGKRLREIPLKDVERAALAPDGKTIAVAFRYGGIGATRPYAIDVATGRILHVMLPDNVKAEVWDTKAMQFQRDSRTLDVATARGGLMRFDTATGEDQSRYLADWRATAHPKAVRPMPPQIMDGAFSADAGTLVFSADESVHVWDVATGKMRRQIRIPHDHGCFISVAPDGKTIATSDMQYPTAYGHDTIRLYDLESGQLILTLEPAGNRARAMAFSPDDTKLVTGFSNGSAVVWDVRR